MATWTVEHSGPIAIATFSNPPINEMSYESIGELHEVLDSLHDRADVSVIVLTGGIAGYFVARAGLAQLYHATKEGNPPLERVIDAWARTLTRLETVNQPVIAAINGQAWAGGFEVALACTLRVAAETASMGQPEVWIGITPGGQSTQRIPRLAGAGRAADLLLSGRIFGAQEGLSMGLVDAVLPAENFLQRVVEWAQPIAQKQRPALVALKRLIVASTHTSFDEGCRLEREAFLALQRSEAALATEQAWLEQERAAAQKASG